MPKERIMTGLLILTLEKATRLGRGESVLFEHQVDSEGARTKHLFR